jgi:transposase-like protein
MKGKTMTCHTCKLAAKKFGKDGKGNQRFRCSQCRRIFRSIERIENMYLSIDKALLCLNMLVEGRLFAPSRELRACIVTPFLI